MQNGSARTRPHRPGRPRGAGVWAVGLLGHPRTALVELGALLLYLAAASLWPPPPGADPGTPGALYAWWPLKILLGLLVLSMVCATLTRVPLRWSNLGVWLSHLGVIVLAGGAGWYVAGRACGLAVAVRRPDGQLTPVERLYLSDTAAIYVGTGGAGIGEQTPVTQMLSLKPGRTVKLPVDCPVEGVSISAREFLPAAELGYEWRDDGPAEVPAARIAVGDGPNLLRGVLCPRYGFARELKLPDCVIRLAGGDKSADDPTTRPERQDQDVVVISQAGDGRAAVLVATSDGRSAQQEAGVGEQMRLNLAGREVVLIVERFFARAWRAWRAYPAESAAAGPAAKVQLTVGQWTGWQWLGFEEFLPPQGVGHAAGDLFPDEIIQRVHLPDGRTLWLGFAPQSRALGTPFRVVRHESPTYAGSDKARDYACWLAPAAPAPQPEPLVCRMNRPVTIGGYRIYQQQWQGGAGSPRQISFMVSARPGMWAVWAGAVLICLGLPYNFYVKPLLLRRKKAVAP